MAADPEMKLLNGTGLTSLRCTTCGHNGFRAVDGIRKLFGGQHEHVCSYGPSLLTLTILFSGTALTLFRGLGMNPSEAAIYCAQWALLSGQVAGTVNLLGDASMLVRCHDHLLREMRTAIEETHLLTPSLS